MTKLNLLCSLGPIGFGQRFPFFSSISQVVIFYFFFCMAGHAMRGGQKGLGTGLEVPSPYKERF